MSVGGNPFAYTVGSETPATVATALATLINNDSGYTAFANGGTIYATAVSGSAPTVTLHVDRSMSAPNATVYGALSLTWTQDVTLTPPRPRGVGRQRGLDGVRGQQKIASSGATPVTGLVSALQGSGYTVAPGSGGDFVLTVVGTPVAVTLTELRTEAANQTSTTADTQAHYQSRLRSTSKARGSTTRRGR